MVEFQTQNRGYRETSFCPSLFCYISYLNTPCLQLLPFVSSFAASSQSFSSSPSDASAALSLAPLVSIPSWSHHLQKTQAPGLQIDCSHRSIIGRVTIYWAIVFFLLLIYRPIYSKPASPISAASGWYSHPPSPRLLGCLPVVRCATLCWKIPRAQSIWGVSTHVSYPKIDTAWTNALKTKPDILRSALPWPRILVICFQLFWAFLNFPATSVQPSSPAIITRPSYLNEVTVSSVSP